MARFIWDYSLNQLRKNVNLLSYSLVRITKPDSPSLGFPPFPVIRGGHVTEFCPMTCPWMDFALVCRQNRRVFHIISSSSALMLTNSETREDCVKGEAAARSGRETHSSELCECEHLLSWCISLLYQNYCNLNVVMRTFLMRPVTQEKLLLCLVWDEGLNPELHTH